MQTLTPAYTQISLPLPSVEKASDRSMWVISLSVILIHLSFIIWSASNTSSMKPVYKAQERFVVKTITLGEAVPKSKAPLKAPLSVPIEALAEEPLIAEQIAVVEEVAVATPVVIAAAVEIQEIVIPIPEPAPILVEAPLPKQEPEIIKPVQPNQPDPKSVQSKKVELKPVVKKALPKKVEVAPKKVETVPKSKPKSEPIKKAPQKPPEKVVPQKKPPIKKTVPKAIEVAKVDPKAEAVKVKQRELLAKAQESIGKIQKNSSKISAVKNSSAALTALPGKIEGLQIDAITIDSGVSLSATELSYRDELASRLKLLLKLPEYGQVKIKLTLDRSGKVAKLDIISAESSANRKYVEKIVPNLTLPPFGYYFSGKSDYTFAITLSNDI